MLEDVIKTKNVCGKSVSILLYSIDKEDRPIEDNHTHYYEVRVSENNKNDDFKTFAENYIKRQALKLFNMACEDCVC